MVNSAIQKENKFDVKKLSGLSILLVEDNPLNVKLVSILLFQKGLKLQLAQNGAEAVEKIKATAFDIVLMDMEMPVMDGYQATSVIRQELKDNVPIIAMTAHALPGEREKCLQLGMNEYISKPVNIDLLCTVIYKLTSGRKDALKKMSLSEPPCPPVISEEICNLRYLTDITRGNKKIIKKVIGVFLEETPKELSALTSAIKKVNYAIISNISHKIKSSFSLLGISVLGPVLEEMERLGAIASGIEKIEKLNYRVNTVFGMVMKEMKNAGTS